MTILNKGFKYNFQYKPKVCIGNLLLGACLHSDKIARWQVARSVKNPYMKHNTPGIILIS